MEPIFAYCAQTFHGQFIPQFNSFHPRMCVVEQRWHYQVDTSPRLAAQDEVNVHGFLDHCDRELFETRNMSQDLLDFATKFRECITHSGQIRSLLGQL